MGKIKHEMGNIEKVNVDFTGKISACDGLHEMDARDVNNVLVFLNYCFNMKNNFMVDGFNMKELHVVYKFYNTLKSNILDAAYLFRNINDHQLKTMKFIITSVIDDISKLDNFNDDDIWEPVTTESLRRVHASLGMEISSRKHY
jgi:hypothetical protein